VAKTKGAREYFEQKARPLKKNKAFSGRSKNLGGTWKEVKGI